MDVGIILPYWRFMLTNGHQCYNKDNNYMNLFINVVVSYYYTNSKRLFEHNVSNIVTKV